MLGALGSMMLVPPGGLGVVDVRDAATLLARAVEPGHGPRRYLAGGRFVTWAASTELLGEAAGVDLHGHVVTAEEMVELGRRFDVQRAEGVLDAPLSEEAAVIMTSGVPTDDSGHTRRPRHRLSAAARDVPGHGGLPAGRRTPARPRSRRRPTRRDAGRQGGSAPLRAGCYGGRPGKATLVVACRTPGCRR